MSTTFLRPSPISVKLVVAPPGVSRPLAMLFPVRPAAAAPVRMESGIGVYVSRFCFLVVWSPISGMACPAS